MWNLDKRDDINSLKDLVKILLLKKVFYVCFLWHYLFVFGWSLWSTFRKTPAWVVFFKTWWIDWTRIQESLSPCAEKYSSFSKFPENRNLERKKQNKKIEKKKIKTFWCFSLKILACFFFFFFINFSQQIKYDKKPDWGRIKIIEMDMMSFF